MKTFAVGELKANFSKILDEVKNGEEITVSFGKAHKKVAVIIPYEQYKSRTTRKLGILEKKASCHIEKDFSISDDALLDS